MVTQLKDNILGQNVLLRPINMNDTSLIIKWKNSPSVRENFLSQDLLTKEIHTRWMKDKVSTGEVIQYIIIQKATDMPIGSVYLRDVSQNHQCAEFGIFIGEDTARGKGVGSETTKLFTDYAFNMLKLHRVYLRVLDSNLSAIRSYEKAGFVLEGVAKDMVKINGEFRNVVFMAKIANEHYRR